MRELDLDVTDEIAAAEIRSLLDRLYEHNRPYLGERDGRPLGVFARDGGLRGGLTGETARGFLHVDNLWVHPAERGRGLGSRLLGAAETAAARRGCHSSWLDTYSFQARPFYERHGYEVFGELAGFANGHRRYFLVKRLAGGRLAHRPQTSSTRP